MEFRPRSTGVRDGEKLWADGVPCINTILVILSQAGNLFPYILAGILDRAVSYSFTSCKS